MHYLSSEITEYVYNLVGSAQIKSISRKPTSCLYILYHFIFTVSRLTDDRTASEMYFIYKWLRQFLINRAQSLVKRVLSRLAHAQMCYRGVPKTRLDGIRSQTFWLSITRIADKASGNNDNLNVIFYLSMELRLRFFCAR